MEYLTVTECGDGKIRAATPEELEELKQFYVAEYGEGNVCWLGASYVIVVPDYVTGGPNYFGKVLIALHDGCPSQVESYIWRDNRMERVSGE